MGKQQNTLTKAERKALKRARKNKQSLAVQNRRDAVAAEKAELAARMQLELMTAVEWAVVAASWPEYSIEEDPSYAFALLTDPGRALRDGNELLFTMDQLRATLRETGADQRLQELSTYKLDQLLGGIGVVTRTLFGPGTGLSSRKAYGVTEPEDTGAVGPMPGLMEALMNSASLEELERAMSNLPALAAA